MPTGTGLFADANRSCKVAGRFLAVVDGPGATETALSSTEPCEGHIRSEWAALRPPS